MVGRVAPERARAARGPSLPERAGPAAGRPPLGHPAALPRGARRAARGGPGADGLASVGVDSWGVDYGLLDEAGSLLGDPYHYRDGRTSAAVDAVHAVIPPAELYARTGLQFLPFNTIYQLAAARGTPALAAAGSMLLIPDLIGFWLSGDARQRGHQRLDDGAARRPPADVGHRAHRCDRAAGPDLHVARRTRRRRRPAARRGPRRDRCLGRDAADPRRVARHGVGGRRRAGRRAATSRTSPAARGRSSGSSSTRRS